MEDNNIFDFDIDDIEVETDKKIKKDLRLKQRYIDYHFSMLKNLENYKMPKVNEVDFLITEMSYNAYTFVPFILKTESIEKMSISTYNLSKKAILSFGDFMENNEIQELFIILSSFMEYDHKYIIDILEEFKNKYSLNYRLQGNHSKINCIKTNQNYYIISGSGNFSNNIYPEQYTIFNNKVIYDNIIKYLFD